MRDNTFHPVSVSEIHTLNLGFILARIEIFLGCHRMPSTIHSTELLVHHSAWLGLRLGVQQSLHLELRGGACRLKAVPSFSVCIVCKSEGYSLSLAFDDQGQIYRRQWRNLQALGYPRPVERTTEPNHRTSPHRLSLWHGTSRNQFQDPRLAALRSDWGQSLMRVRL